MLKYLYIGEGTLKVRIHFFDMKDACDRIRDVSSSNIGVLSSCVFREVHCRGPVIMNDAICVRDIMGQPLVELCVYQLRDA